MTATASPARHRPALAWAAMLVSGLGWGSTGPFSKLAVSTGHAAVGIAFWTALLGGVILTTLLAIAGRRPRLGRRRIVFFLVCGLLGTALPNWLSYTAYAHLPIGVIVIVISLVPMMTLLLVLLFRTEEVDLRRALGLGLAAVAVLMIVLPQSSLPEPGQAAWVALPVLVALSYAGENVYIAAARPPATDGLTILAGLSWAALLLLLPVVAATDAWVDITRLGPPELAIFAITGLHLCAYFSFIWLVTHAGPVFAAQVGYIVTGTGVLMGMAIYGERPSPWIWGALALMFAGMALVKPRR